MQAGRGASTSPNPNLPLILYMQYTDLLASFRLRTVADLLIPIFQALYHGLTYTYLSGALPRRDRVCVSRRRPRGREVL